MFQPGRDLSTTQNLRGKNVKKKPVITPLRSRRSWRSRSQSIPGLEKPRELSTGHDTQPKGGLTVLTNGPFHQRLTLYKHIQGSLISHQVTQALHCQRAPQLLKMHQKQRPESKREGAGAGGPGCFPPSHWGHLSSHQAWGALPAGRMRRLV